MPNYRIRIIDTVEDEYSTLLEMAAAKSVVLSYKGSDDKDDLAIVGSTLKFTILVAAVDNADGVLDHLFTSDETRYRIELSKEEDDSLIWHGFNLPDSYSEPYKQGVLYVDITATDGLGRLKGKFLPDYIYNSENAVTTILAECLKLTGLSMPFYFCPAIENFTVKEYHNIYLNGADFVDGDKKEDAYAILETLAKDLLFCVFQSMGYWHLEGLNKRNLVTYNVDEYDADGVFVANKDLTRNIKVIDNQAMATPIITTVPPYGIITVEHEREPVNFPAAIANEINDGWAVTTGVNPEIHTTEWLGFFEPKAVAPDYSIVFPNNNTNSFSEVIYVNLKRKLFLQLGEKYKLSLTLQLNDTLDNQENQNVTTWIDPITYKIVFDGDVLYANYETSASDEVIDSERLYFQDSKTATLTFEFVCQTFGLLDVVFFQPYKTGEEIESIQINNLSLERIGFEDTEVFTSTISQDYTRTKDIELTFADDPSGFSKAFLLEKLDVNSTTYKQYTVPILYSFSQFGKHYSVVQLDGANLIKENLEVALYEQDLNVKVLDVIYNYQNNEQMVVETDTADLTGNFFARVFLKEDGPSERRTWTQWADSFYGVEQDRFAEAFLKVYRRLFIVPHEKIDLTLFFPVLFNDMIRFTYNGLRNYTISNIRGWDLDSGKSTLSISRAIYQDDEDPAGDNLPPLVDAGPDLYYPENTPFLPLLASASDPDGFIASQQWTEITSNGAQLVNPNNLQAGTFLPSAFDFYTFRITVTDNEGATAFDEMNCIKVKAYTITLTEILSIDNDLTNGEKLTRHYSLGCSPALPDDFNLTINARVRIDLGQSTKVDETAEGTLKVRKNGTNIVDLTHNLDTLAGYGLARSEFIPFNYNNTDTTEIRITAEADYTLPNGFFARCEVDFDIESIFFATGEGIISNSFPISREVLAEVI